MCYLFRRSQRPGTHAAKRRRPSPVSASASDRGFAPATRSTRRSPAGAACISRATAPVASRAPQATTAVTAAIGATLRYTASVISDVNGGADTRFGDQQIRGFDTTQQCLFLDGLRQPNTRYVQFMGLDTWARSASRS